MRFFAYLLTFSLPSSKSAFSQPFEEKWTSEVARIGSIIIFHICKLWKGKFFILCDVIFLVRPQGKFEVDHLNWEGNSSQMWWSEHAMFIPGNAISTRMNFQNDFALPILPSKKLTLLSRNDKVPNRPWNSFNNLRRIFVLRNTQWYPACRLAHQHSESRCSSPDFNVSHFPWWESSFPLSGLRWPVCSRTTAWGRLVSLTTRSFVFCFKPATSRSGGQLRHDRHRG